jgi:hypothetical protein
MTIPGRRLFFLFLAAALLIACSGCISVQQPVNKIPNPETAIGNPVTGVVSQSAVLASGPRGAASPSPEPGERYDRTVLRGKPFTITGTVNNQSITKVQVWMLNTTVSTRLVPVMADGTFQVDLNPEETLALPRTFTSAIVVQYPSPPDHFAVALDPGSGRIIGINDTVPALILSELNDKGYYPTLETDFLDQAISGPLTGNSCDIYFLNGADATIDLRPVNMGPPGTIVVAGNTSLPAGTPLFISISTINGHPTPKNYDWSHEMAEGTAQVVTGSDGTNRFSGAIDTSLLNTGRYMVVVETGNEALQANAYGYADIIAAAATSQETGNYINWSAVALPPLLVNTTMQPVMLAGEWKIVPSGMQQKNNEVSYGSVIDCAPYRICRVFNQSGVQVLAVYDSNQARMMEVPDGAAIDQESIGNVTIVRLNEEIILTKIMERTQ